MGRHLFNILYNKEEETTQRYMEEMQDIFNLLESFEIKMTQKTNGVISDILNEVNGSLARVMKLTIDSAERLEVSMKNEFSIVKEQLANRIESKIENDKDIYLNRPLDRCSSRLRKETNVKFETTEPIIKKPFPFKGYDNALDIGHVDVDLDKKEYVKITRGIKKEYRGSLHSTEAKLKETADAMVDNIWIMEQSGVQSNDKTELQCRECEKTFASNPNLKAHIKGTHEKIKDFNCNECDYSSSYKSHVTRHIKFKHSDD